MKKCLIIGAVMLDFVIEIDDLPKQGDDIYAKSQLTTIGGCAYNVADILKLSRVPFTLFAPIGNGEYGNIISSKMVWSGHSSPLTTNRGDNGYSLCLIDRTGERTFITLPGVECNYVPEWFDNINTEDYDCVYFSGYEVESSDAIISFCESHPELKVYYAPGPRIMNINYHERIFALNPVLHLNEQEALDITGKTCTEDAAQHLFGLTKNTVIITLGDKGCYYKVSDSCNTIPGVTANLVDTVGAGDSHIGAFIAQQKMGRDLHASVVVANKVSATIVEQRGPSMARETFDKITF